MNHAKIGTLAIEIGINVQIQQMFFVWGARATFPHYDRVNRYTIVTTIYDEAFIEPDRISECYFSCCWLLLYWSKKITEDTRKTKNHIEDIYISLFSFIIFFLFIIKCTHTYI